MAATTPANQQSDVEHAGKAAGPCVLVLFGAAGDLTKHKLIPALFNLVKAKLLPDSFAVVGGFHPDGGPMDANALELS